MIQKDELFALFSPTLEYWIKQEILAAQGEEESVASAEAWVRARGQNELKDAVELLPRFKKKYWHIMGDMIGGLSAEFTMGGALGLIKLLF